jgi:parallel beta-helix repeat protein
VSEHQPATNINEHAPYEQPDDAAGLVGGNGITIEGNTIAVSGTVVSSSTALPGQFPYATGTSSDYAWGNTDFYNPMRAPFNAVANGAYNALSSRYSTLAEAQAVYGFVTALTQQIDWAAIQLAICVAAGGGPNGPGTAFTATTHSTTELSGISSFTGLGAGVPISGAGIADGTAVLSITATASATVTVTPGAGGGRIWIPAGKRVFVTQNQFAMAGHVHFWGPTRARTEREGNVGALITTNSANAIHGPTFTGKTNTSTSLTEVTAHAELWPFMPISGTGIPVGTHITKIEGETVTISQAATASASGVSIATGVPMFNVAGCLHYGFHYLSLQVAGTFGPVSPGGEGNIVMAISDFSGEGQVVEGLGIVDNCYFRNFGGTAMLGFYGNVQTITHNYFDEPVGHQIMTANPEQGGLTPLPGSNVGTDGFIAYNFGSFCYGNGSAPGAVGDGLRMEGGGTYLVAHNNFYEMAHGIYLNQVGACRIIGNRCEGHDKQGILLEGNLCYHNIVSENTLFNNGNATANASSLAIVRAPYNSVTNNQIFNEGAYGDLEYSFECVAGSKEIKNVKATGPGAALSSMRFGTPLYSHLNLLPNTYVLKEVSAGNYELASPAISTGTFKLKVSPTMRGILLSEAEDTNVVGNSIYGMGETGIYVGGGANNQITGNMISVCGRQGIYCTGSSYNQIADNYIYNAGLFPYLSESTLEEADGVFVTKGKNNTIHRITIAAQQANAYSSGTTYKPGEYASESNKVYACIKESTGNAVSNTTYWVEVKKVLYGIHCYDSGSKELSGTQVTDCFCVGGNYNGGAFNATEGVGTIVKNFRGYTVGEVTVSVPASGGKVASAAYDRMFYVTPGTHEAQIVVGNMAHVIKIPASGTTPVTVFLPAGIEMEVKGGYGSGAEAPTWYVVGNAN